MNNALLEVPGLDQFDEDQISFRRLSSLQRRIGKGEEWGSRTPIEQALQPHHGIPLSKWLVLNTYNLYDDSQRERYNKHRSVLGHLGISYETQNEPGLGVILVPPGTNIRRTQRDLRRKTARLLKKAHRERVQAFVAANGRGANNSRTDWYNRTRQRG